VTVVFDATMLLLLLRPEVSAPLDPATGKPVEHAEERIAQLVSDLEKLRVTIIIPTPALSELLVHSGAAGPELVKQISGAAAFRIAPFDTRAAIEVAEMTRAAIDAGDKRRGESWPWVKIKYDRQIVAIAKVVSADTIYTDDEGLRRFAEAQGLRVVRLAELPLPAERAQLQIDLPVSGVGPDEDEGEATDNES
jgi:predicted nucleic acid-binding protein